MDYYNLPRNLEPESVWNEVSESQIEYEAQHDETTEWLHIGGADIDCVTDMGHGYLAYLRGMERVADFGGVVVTEEGLDDYFDDGEWIGGDLAA